MDILVYDMEVYKYDWFITIYSIRYNKYTQIHNNIIALQRFYESNKENIWAGHNINHYDNIILKALIKGIEGEKLKDISNKIIQEEKGNYISKVYGLNNIELYPLDVMQDAIRYSLKEVEGYLGMSIEETEIPFDLDRALTEEEIKLVFKYNKHDVEATTEEILLRFDRLQNKLRLLSEYSLPKKMIAYTNQELCAEILKADYTKFNDGLQPYNPAIAPINIKKYTECVDFFSKCDKLDYKRELKIDIAKVSHTLSNGGIHGALKNYYYSGEIWLIDVSSYYPNTMINFNLCSRAMSNPDNFKNLVNTRMNAKNMCSNYKELLKNSKTKEEKEKYSKLLNTYSGKKDALKLPINTTSGAMKAKFSKLFDERNNNWMCITGQLLLVDLIESMENYMDLIQSNTDGIIIIPKNKEYCDKKIKEWEDKTGLILEKTIANTIYQKDVNNYILLDNNNHVKTKGGFVAQYHNEERYADALRRNCEIIDDAVVDFLLYGKSLKETIYNFDLPLLKFQIIKKLGGMYDDIVLYKYDNEGNEIHVKDNINRVNRIFATTDKLYGKLMKKHNKKETYDSVEGCPDNCLIINKDIRKMKAGDIPLDFDWYIELAKDRIIKFLLSKEEQNEFKKLTINEIWDILMEK